MSDGQQFLRPVEGTHADGTVERFAGARHERGSNGWLRQQRSPLLSIVCNGYGRRRLFGIILRHPNDGSLTVALAGGGGGGQAPLAGWARLQELDGLCPCGHTHTVDLVALRSAYDRLRLSPAKRRVVDVASVSVGPEPTEGT